MGNAYGFPAASINEMNRTRKKTNSNGNGILTNMVNPPSIADPTTLQVVHAGQQPSVAGPPPHRAPSPEQNVANATGGSPTQLPANQLTIDAPAQSQAKTPSLASVGTSSVTQNVTGGGGSTIDGRKIDDAYLKDMQGRKRTFTTADGSQATYFISPEEAAMGATKANIAAPAPNYGDNPTIRQGQNYAIGSRADRARSGSAGPSIAAPRSSSDYMEGLNVNGADASLLAAAYAGGAAKRDAARYKLESDAAANQQAQAIDAPLKQAQADAYRAAAEKDRFEATPEYLTAKGKKDDSEFRQKTMEKLIGTNEGLYKSILDGLKNHPDASNMSPEQLNTVARNEAWKATLGSFQNISGLFVDGQGNPTEDGQLLKSGFDAYSQALSNLDARKASGQLDDKAYSDEYKKINQLWINVRNGITQAQKTKTPSITG